jgi:hypothetical protein
MSGMTPPEVDPLDFNQIFSGLQAQSNKRTQSNGSSFEGYYDEPGRPQAQRQGSGSNTNQNYGYQQSSEHSRQNSYPFESTMIATAPRRASAVNLNQDKGNGNNGNMGGPSAYMGYGDGNIGTQQHYTSTPDPIDQYLNYDSGAFGTPHPPQRQIQHQSQQQAYTPSYQSVNNANNYASTSTANQQMYTPNWEDQFLQDPNNFGQQGAQPTGGYNGDASGQNGYGGDGSFEADIAEL